MQKILITPSSFGQCGLEPIEILKENGFEVANNPYGRKLTPDETVALAADVIGVLAGVELYNEEVINQLPNLKCISRVGVGMDSVDTPYAKSKGIEVVNTPNGPTKAVAELSIALAFDLLRDVSLSDRRMRNGVWKKSIGRLIEGKMVGIVGLGRIGKATAKLYQALGCTIIASDKYPDEKWADQNNVSFMELNDLLQKAEIISLHVPGTSGEPLINGKELSLLREDAILINLARGGVVNESDLFTKLSERNDLKVALDVFEAEPYNGSLIELENVTLTPHLGSYAKEAKLEMEIQAVQNLLKSI